ncbi:potassium channel family protein [Caldinitratiruptor microaerophilus]|uniref:Trk system potassium uptake protein TrkA n=1 Tax=Caldinitratiruptor microaerophilus TaxID=671077 RepID=A0AA35G8B2_9FIRM|nr:TrkA family potassium uptake protein [Caldinitratiruptor microaerophilus]BDG59089.1 Trk system potassium uptake protein TrkA [Caldinitratiruptor microaerophilus]
MHVVIVGCGRVGSRLATSLAVYGHDVVVVDRRPDAFANLGAAFNGSTVVGVGIDEDVLRRAGTEHADAFAAVTSEDAVNVVAAQVAREVFGVPRVVARVNDPANEENFREFGIATFSPTDLGAAAVISMLTLGHVQVRQAMGAGEVLLVEFPVSARRAGVAAAALEIPGKLRVAAVLRGGIAHVPGGDFRLEAGDTVVAAVRRDLADSLPALLGEGETG